MLELEKCREGELTGAIRLGSGRRTLTRFLTNKVGFANKLLLLAVPVILSQFMPLLGVVGLGGACTEGNCAFAADKEKTEAGKVLVVMMFDEHCVLWCGKVRPIMKELAGEFGERVVIDEVDASKGKDKEAAEKCKQLGILSYFKDVEAVPVVLIFDGKRRLVKELNGPKTKEFYKTAIEKAIK